MLSRQFTHRIRHTDGNNHCKIVCVAKTTPGPVEKNWFVSILACGISPILWFSVNANIHVSNTVQVIYVSYFAVSLVSFHTIGRDSMCRCVSDRKSMSNRFPMSPELMPNCGTVPET